MEMNREEYYDVHTCLFGCHFSFGVGWGKGGFALLDNATSIYF